MSTFSRKPSSNGVSTDDDHFWRSKPPKPSDYAEIFGGVASSCSIPVLDLPPAGGFDGRDVFCSSAVDYLDIFGGFEDGAFGVEYEELAGALEEERIQKETKSFQDSSDVSRYVLKDLRWDNSPVSSKEATNKLSDSTEQTNLSHQKQNSESKDSKANGRTYVEAVHAVPGATSEDDEYLSPPPKFDASPVPTSRSSRHSLVSNGDVGINFTKTVQPAASFGSTMRLGDDLYSDQKPSDLRSTPSEDTSANEQYHSCSSTDQSEFDGNESLVDLSASHQCSDDSGSGGVAEVNQLKKPASPTPTPSVASKNYTQDMTRPIMEQPVLNPIYSGDVPSQLHIDSYSNAPSNGSAFAGDSTVQGQSANGSKSERSLQNQSTSSYNQYMDSNNGKLQSKTLLKASSLDSLTKNCGHVSENLPTRGLHHAHSFDSSSATPNDKSCHDARFLTISSVNLRTQPSKVPPPARPPPKICIGQAPPKIVKSADLKACTVDSSHFFDVEVDASSAAAASAAAMKEAMEHAQARLKSAKESMERKKENLQSRKRFAKTEISTGKEEKVGVVAQVAHSSGEAVIPNDDQINNIGGHRPKSRRLGEAVPSHQASEKYFDLDEDSLKKRQDSSSRSSQVPYVQGDRAAEWKVEEQFFELVNNEKKPAKVQEYFVFEVDKNKQKKSIKTDEEKTNKKADKLVHDVKGVDKLAVHKDGSLGDKENGFKEPREVREADKIKEVQEPLLETPLQANHDELIINLVSDQEKEIKKQAECRTSCEHDLNISEETTTRIDYGTKSNGLSESSKENETSVQDDHAFERNEKLVNSTEDGCLHEHDKNIDSRSHTLEEENESQECRNSIEALPVSHALEIPNDVDHLVEVVAVPSEDACDHLEKKPIPKEHIVPTQEGETNLNGAKESCDEMEPDKTKVSGRKTNESEDHADNESPPCSGTGVENATKVESSWQYICEKIIIETQERSEQDVENKEAVKSDSELKHFQDQQVNIHGDNKPGKDEAFEQTVASCNAQTEGRITESAQKAFQTVGNETEVLDSQPANASSVDHPDIVQTAEKFTEREDPEISDNNIARNSEIEERMREERAKKEIEEELERARKLEEEKEREREREKDRLAFERASREARDRAIMEARERAERAAVERVTAEARQRALAEAREKAERASAEAALAEKASKEARLRAERAAVERATAEARERAAERALAEKTAQDAKQRAEKSTTVQRDQQKKASEYDMHAKKCTGMKHSASFPDFPQEHQKRSDSSDNVGRFEGESAVRCKARLERHQRTVERAAKALAEKNMRDILAQREQAERNRFAETLDADVRRWSAGKEGNLRALLSTLQYILGPDSGWQPVSLTEVITAAAVKKVYRKATLCVHPDKLQQRGASIQQKYICEKVFDLLKEAWNRFNSEER